MSKPVRRFRTQYDLTAQQPAAPHARPDSGEAFLQDPTETHPRMHSDDVLAEVLGEDYVRSATSGEEYSTSDEDEDEDEDEELGVRYVVFPGDVTPVRSVSRKQRA